MCGVLCMAGGSRVSQGAIQGAIGLPYSIRQDGTYSVQVACRNCMFFGLLTFPRGKMVDDHDCPGCGCKTLNRQPMVVF